MYMSTAPPALHLVFGGRLGLGGTLGDLLDPGQALVGAQLALADVEGERLRPGGGELLLGDPPALLHAGEDAAHVLVPFGIELPATVMDVAALRAGQDGGEERPLERGQVGGALAEVMARGHPDAVDARPELDGVEIKLEDALFGDL